MVEEGLRILGFGWGGGLRVQGLSTVVLRFLQNGDGGLYTAEG